MRVFTIQCPNTRAQRAFTMVEIALSIAVVAFALVAIMGVLPTGMTVQRDNREDVIIGQEGRFWLEAIKGGARGIDDVSSYVEEVTLTNGNVRIFNILNKPNAPVTGRDIIALLSTPKRHTNDNAIARIRAITGPATEMGTNATAAFRYQLRAEVQGVVPIPPAFANQNSNSIAFNKTMSENLWDVRLVLRWPVVERGNSWHVGNNRKVFRARVAGTPMIETNLSKNIPANLALKTMAPNRFTLQQ